MAKANRARLTVVHVMAPPALALPGEMISRLRGAEQRGLPWRSA